jgi:hypothetical protein
MLKGCQMQIDATRKAVLNRIERIEEAIIKGREYVENGKHANWRGFRPLFDGKLRAGKELPPHKDWVKNVFLRRRERALKYNKKVLQRLEREISKRAKDA